MSNRLPAIHPGEVLREEFMVPLELSANRLAQALVVPANRVTSIAKGARSVSADTAMRLATYFDTTPLFWMNLQRDYDLEIAEAEKGPAIRRQVAKRPSAKSKSRKRAARTNGPQGDDQAAPGVKNGRGP